MNEAYQKYLQEMQAAAASGETQTEQSFTAQ